MFGLSKKTVFRLILLGLLLSGFSKLGCQEEEEPESDYSDYTEEKVPFPEPGLPSEPDKLCNSEPDNPDEPLVSNRAATVSLRWENDIHDTAIGTIKFADSIEDSVTIVSAVEVTEPPSAKDMRVTDLQPTADGYSFRTANPAFHNMTLTVTFEIRCGDNKNVTKQVSASTIIYLCDDHLWASSGQLCSMSAPNAETCGCSVVPMRNTRIELVASIGRLLFLMIDREDASKPHKVTWKPLKGELIDSSTTSAIWELSNDSEPHLIQAVISDDNETAIKTLRVRRLP